MKFINNIIPLLFLSMLVLGLHSCVEDYEIESTETITPAPKELINAHIYGRVIDESNNALQGASVTLHTRNGEETANTDEKGYFEFEDARLVGKSAFLKVKYNGKFDGFRRMSAIKNKWNYTEVKMLEKEVVGTVNAGVGGSVQTNGGAKLELPSDAVVKKNGAPYNGVISVAMQWIDPTAEDLTQRIVGDLSGIDIEGQEVALGTYGMMVVELLDNAGNELEIAEGKNAELTYPLPDDIHGDPPQTVPMWTYDEVLGTWVEEGVASLKEDEYVATVSHFSAWNVDWKGETIEIQGNVTLNGQTGSMLSSYQLYVSSPVFGIRGGYLTPDGEFLFYRFPANEEFTLKIINICGQVIYEETYGPYSQNTDLGTIDISASNQNDLTISGTILDCNNDPAPNALIQIDYDSIRLYAGEADMNGMFELLIPYCGTPVDATISAIDVENKKISMPQSFTINGSDVDLGDIIACDEAEEFIYVTVDNSIDFPFTHPNYIGIRGTRLEAEGSGGYFFINTTEDIDAVGTYEGENYSLYSSNMGSTNGYWSTSPPDMTVNVTEYSDVPGELIRGTFTGTVTDSLQSSLPIEGEFKVKVD